MEFTDTVTPSFEQYKQNMPYTIGATNPDKRDMFREWAQMYYPNAFQAALLNYQNEYDKPVNQMLRYQEAGLNPYSFQPSQSSSGASGSKPGVVSQTAGERVQNALKGVDSTLKAAQTARELYDYINYGAETSYQRKRLASYQADSAAVQYMWDSYWNTGLDSSEDSAAVRGVVGSSPRARYMEQSTQRIEKQISQLEYMVTTLYPSQVEQNKANAALKDYEKQIKAGNYDAILQINTGNPTADSVLRMLAMILINKI